MNGADTPDPTYVAPSVPIALLLATVRYPDGNPVQEPDATVAAKCDAVLLGDADPERAWRDIPIHVTVQVEGYAEFAFDWTAGTAAQPGRVLTRSPAK